jgi:distribution and morphology protein 34
MAFNFNWSPLIADTVRAREMLTTALNKSPKPPIIVDDIIVTELNLGTQPPDLEILEVGDLAEDRFRGIFKMSYSGDAFLTLKTRVQANPLNTYLSTRPSFATPEPLAAASGLTIPLAITLSDIRLSGFVILVFSKQKGLTLVFRNDPLESLKVSSTFDSIPFVRDYLQRVIEEQLRVLFMEDLPAILHRLSLRLWSPDYCDPMDPIIPNNQDDTAPIDPLASPPHEAVDWLETIFGDDSIPSMALDTRIEPHATFSQKNLEILSSLGDKQRTLAIATPTISHAIFRAWAVAGERSSGIHTPIMPSFSRANSTYGSASSTTGANSDTASEVSRPTLSSSHSYAYSRGGARQRKPKRRVIDLRKRKDPDASESEPNTNSPTPEPTIAPSSAPSVMLEVIEESPKKATTPAKPAINVVHASGSNRPGQTDIDDESIISGPPAYEAPVSHFNLPNVKQELSEKPRRPLHLKTASAGSLPMLARSMSADRMAFSGEGSSGGILEQAWLRKMARDIEKKVDEERASSSKGRSSPVDGDEHAVDAPPAYVS